MVTRALCENTAVVIVGATADSRLQEILTPSELFTYIPGRYSALQTRTQGRCRRLWITGTVHGLYLVTIRIIAPLSSVSFHLHDNAGTSSVLYLSHSGGREVRLSAQLGRDKAGIWSWGGGGGAVAPVVPCVPGKDVFCAESLYPFFCNRPVMSASFEEARSIPEPRTPRVRFIPAHLLWR